MMWRRAFVVVTLAVLLVPVGCDNQAEPVVLPAVDASVYAAPESVARLAVETMQAELAAVAKRDRRTAAAQHARLLELAAAEKIQAAVDRQPMYKAVTGEVATPGIVRNWPGTIAYYADKLALDQMRPTSVTADSATVLVPAGEATLRVGCARGSDQRWRVARVDFAPAGASESGPATEVPPASQPAP